MIQVVSTLTQEGDYFDPGGDYFDPEGDYFDPEGDYADEQSGEVSLLLESGETKDDLNLPSFVKLGEPTDDDKKVTADILAAQEKGDEITVIVISACGMEKIITVKASEAK